jgi:hypothetical protein
LAKELSLDLMSSRRKWIWSEPRGVSYLSLNIPTLKKEERENKNQDL